MSTLNPFRTVVVVYLLATIFLLTSICDKG
jgi:hypothetical protein